MSGQLFVDALRRIGYPNEDQLDGPSLDWMFDCEPLQPFLHWFCNEIGSANVLDPKEIEEFQRLETSNEGILEGEQLEKSLKNLSLIEGSYGEDLAEDRLREEVAHLEEELRCKTSRKNVLVQQRDMLVMHQTALTDRLNRMDSIVNASCSEFKKCLEKSQVDNSKMNAVLESVSPAICKLTNLYRENGAGTEFQRKNENPVFLSHLDLEPYYKTEEAFTQDLVNFTKKQFFEGIAEMAGQNEGSHYEFLEIGNPDSSLVKGKSEEVNLDDCKELARLQSFYSISECNRINALIEEKNALSVCDFQEDLIVHLKKHPYPNDIPSLSARLREAQSVLSQISRDISKLADQQIPGLVKDSGALQVAKVLRGDYNLKVARQDYFTSNQDQVIEQLVVQRSRNEFLLMALELESKGHRDLHKLLLAISLLLQQTYNTFQERLKMMSELESSAANQQRTTIDSRDKFLHHLHHVLDCENSNGESSMQQQHKLFVTYSELAQNAEKLANEVTALKASESTANQIRDDRIASLKQQVDKCESVLYPDGLTNTSQPVLTPRPILDSMAQVDGLMLKLEQAVIDVLKDVEQKKKALQVDPLLTVERELFVYFFNDADRLRRAFADIQSKLQSRLVK